uniref:Uncharacterized protein n=1 Tax=Caenorhabditis japonica TaxID=281687 RepID=A0A8R1HVS1_CAEJA
MLDGYDLLIKAQCSESMKSIDSEDVIECLNNERREDVRIGLCHRIAFLIYQDSNFGLFPLDTRSSSILASVGGLCKSMIESGSTFGQ